MAIRNNQKKPLTMALRFILKNKILTKADMRNRYLLDAKTMKKIEAGELLMKKTVADFYLAVFVEIIDNYRYNISDEVSVPKINDFLIDLFLVSLGMETHAEKEKKEFMKQFSEG